MTGKGVLGVVSGFSGAGKGSLMKGLLAKYPQYALSISATTRQPRVHKSTGLTEQNGVEYFFVSKEEFERMIDNDELIEYACYQGNYYGTPRKYVEDMLNEGKDVILEIEVQGAGKVKAKLSDTVLVFVTPPSAEELKNRLAKRGTETPEQIKGRMRRATEEAEYMQAYDYILVNDNLDESIERLHAIFQSERIKSERSNKTISEMTKELKDLMKGE